MSGGFGSNLEQSLDEELFQNSIKNQTVSVHLDGDGSGHDLDGGFSSLGSPGSPVLGSSPSPQKNEPIIKPKSKMGGIAEIPAFRGARGSGSGREAPQQQQQQQQQQQNQGQQQQRPPDMKFILEQVEGFLLPSINIACPWWRGASANRDSNGNRNGLNNSVANVSLCPDTRLMDVLYQVALADQIRAFQAMYRDNNDEHRLFADLRGSGTSIADKHKDKDKDMVKKDMPHLPTKALMNKIVEGRIRIVALCRLCYGENSVEILRAIIDLAAAYAMQGMWEQVSEQMAIATNKLIAVVNKDRRADQLRTIVRARSAAAKIECTFRILRKHAIEHRGQVTKSVLPELVVALGALTNTTEEEFLLRGGGGGVGGNKNNHGGPSLEEGDKDDGRDAILAHPTQLVALLHGFFARFSHPKHPQHSVRGMGIDKDSNSPNPLLTSPVPSWGQVVDFLRYDCVLMQSWLADLEAGILPQNRAALHVPFSQCDSAKRGISHPAQAAFQFSRSPATTKVLSGGTMGKQLQALKVGMPLWINPQTGEIKKLFLENKGMPVKAFHGNTADQFEKRFAGSAAGSTGTGMKNAATYITSNEHNSPTQTVLYELPVLWEEIMAIHVLELETDPVDLLRAQVMTLLGVCHVFSNKLTSAEENMREALRILESLGLEQEYASCELYNSIAQLMIVKHRAWYSNKKTRATREATRYLSTETGSTAVKAVYTQLKKEFLEESRKQAFSDVTALLDGGGNNITVLSKDEREELQSKAQTILLREHYKKYMANEVDPTVRAVEAAFRYLVRSYEIVSEAHGVNHPASATASLAIASVQNTVGNHESAREWLSRALRCFEKLDPLPVRAIAFVQVQLSQVLYKQEHNDESLCVLDKALLFQVAKAREGIALLQKENISSGYGVFIPALRGTPLYDDVTAALSMNAKVCRMISRRGGQWRAAEQSEISSELVQGAFGWDSTITGETLREVATRFACINDWTKAASLFKRAQDAFEAVNGKECKKAIACARSYNKALDSQRKVETAQQLSMQAAVTESKQQTYHSQSQSSSDKRKGKNMSQSNEKPPQKGSLVEEIDENDDSEQGNYDDNDEESELGSLRGSLGAEPAEWDIGSGLDGGKGGLLEGDESPLTASPHTSPPPSPGPVSRGDGGGRPDYSRGINSSLPGMVTPN